MGRKELLKQCRYYKGETENPFEGEGNTDAKIWFYEQRWVEMTINKDSYLREMADEYARRGLADFHTEIPITLRAILYNRYDHWMQGGEEGYKFWFELEYLKYERMLKNIANGVKMDLVGYIQVEDKAGRIDALIKAVEEEISIWIADALTPDVGKRKYTDSQGKRLEDFYELIFDTIPRKRKAKRKEEIEYLKNGGTKPRPQAMPAFLEYSGMRFILDEGCRRGLLRRINEYQCVWLDSARLYRFFVEKVTEVLGLEKRDFDTDRKSERDWERFAEIIENGKDLTPSAKTSGYNSKTKEYTPPAKGTEIVNGIINAYNRECKPHTGSL